MGERFLQEVTSAYVPPVQARDLLDNPEQSERMVVGCNIPPGVALLTSRYWEFTGNDGAKLANFAATVIRGMTIYQDYTAIGGVIGPRNRHNRVALNGAAYLLLTVHEAGKLPTAEHVASRFIEDINLRLEHGRSTWRLPFIKPYYERNPRPVDNSLAPTVNNVVDLQERRKVV